jgi:hypothetical protein
MAVTEGRSRLNAEVSQASSAFRSRPLRAGGDLSRYRIGGFSDDPNAAGRTPKPKAAPKPKAKTTARKAPAKPRTTTVTSKPKPTGGVGGVTGKPAQKVSTVQHAGWRGYTGQKPKQSAFPDLYARLKAGQQLPGATPKTANVARRPGSNKKAKPRPTSTRSASTRRQY